MGTPIQSEQRRLGFKAAMVLFSVVIALVFGEIALRIMTPAKKEFMIWPPNMHHVFRPDPQIMPGHSAEARFASNSRGLRGPELGPESEARVLAIGGSTTECLYIDETSAWPLRLAKLLTTPGRAVWSASAGLSGMNSSDHVLHAKFLVPQLPRLDVVLALMGVNDVAVALGSPEHYAPMPADVSAQDSETALRRAFQQVPGRLENSWDYDASALKQLALYQLLRRVKIGHSRDLAAHNITNDASGKSILNWRANRQRASQMIDALPDLTPQLAVYRKNLMTFVDLITERKVRLILLTQPTLWRADLNDAEQKAIWMGGKGDFMHNAGLPYYTASALAAAMVKFNEVTLSVCKERGLTCVDLANMIPKDLENFYDDCHFGWHTSERIADIVADAIKKGAPFAND
ncbi:MAG: GDSL-type esterase/lipase family protein [Polyangiaceae bacterium]